MTVTPSLKIIKSKIFGTTDNRTEQETDGQPVLKGSEVANHSYDDPYIEQTWPTQLPAYDAHNTRKGNNDDDPNTDESVREKKTLVCDGSCDQSTPGELRTC